MRSVRPGSALSFDGIASFDRDPHMASSSWFPILPASRARVAEGRRGVLPSRAVIPNSQCRRHGRRGERLIVAIG